MSDLKFSEEARKQLLDNFTTRETKFFELLEASNNEPGFLKKELFEVQGFKVRGLNLKNATKRVKKSLLTAGFHPIASQSNFKFFAKAISSI